MSKIFFSGIGGSGMSALANFMADKGHLVIGSDRAFDKNSTHSLYTIFKNKGITIFPHDGSGIDITIDYAIFSTAIEATQPEFIKAREIGLPIKTRPEFLSEIASGFKTIAVTGTSGKSTISAMLAFLMKKLGFEPNFIGGGKVKQFKSQNNPGNSLIGKSDFLIIEACESDTSLTLYHPLHTIFANLSLDHNTIEKTAEMFKHISSNTKEFVIVNADDKNLNLCNFNKKINFSIDVPSEYQPETIEYQPFRTIFSLHGIKWSLSLPGKHNLYNALSCIALLSEMGISLKDISETLHEFVGLDRRFDVHLNTREHLVIDDYAHNPHKISFLMDCIRRFRNRVCYIFQPHGFGPTLFMKQGYIDVFIKYLRNDDHLFLLPIFYAGGTTQRNISSEDLSYEIRKAGKKVEVLHERSDLFNRLNEWDTYIIFGARDDTLSNFAQDIALKLQ